MSFSMDCLNSYTGSSNFRALGFIHPSASSITCFINKMHIKTQERSIYMQIMFPDQEAPPVVLQKHLEHPGHLGHHHLCGVRGIQRLPDSGGGGQAKEPTGGSGEVCGL